MALLDTHLAAAIRHGFWRPEVGNTVGDRIFFEALFNHLLATKLEAPAMVFVGQRAILSLPV